MKCPDCGTEMKPLATSVYCPNDCDRKVQNAIAFEETPLMLYFDYRPLNTKSQTGPVMCPTGSVANSNSIDPDDSDWIDRIFDGIMDTSTD